MLNRMAKILNERIYFPTCPEEQGDFLKQSVSKNKDIESFLMSNPDKQKRAGRWLWNAPKDVRRLKCEPGYPMAYRHNGMGHFDILFWHPTTHHWCAVALGGSNGHESEHRYQKWLDHDGQGFTATVDECIDMCVNDSINVDRS